MTGLINYGFGITPIIPPRKKKGVDYGEESKDKKRKTETYLAMIVLSALTLVIAWIVVFAVTRIGGG